MQLVAFTAPKNLTVKTSSEYQVVCFDSIPKALEYVPAKHSTQLAEVMDPETKESINKDWLCMISNAVGCRLPRALEYVPARHLVQLVSLRRPGRIKFHQKAPPTT
jgi:hypothetical protein